MNRARYKITQLSVSGEAKLEREDGVVLILSAEWLPDEAREGFTLIGTLNASANEMVVHLAIEAEAAPLREEAVEEDVGLELELPAADPVTR